MSGDKGGLEGQFELSEHSVYDGDHLLVPIIIWNKTMKKKKQKKPKIRIPLPSQSPHVKDSEKIYKRLLAAIKLFCNAIMVFFKCSSLV